MTAQTRQITLNDGSNMNISAPVETNFWIGLWDVENPLQCDPLMQALHLPC